MSDLPELPTARGDIDALNVIRTETALSRFPVHRLAKTGNVRIELKNQAAALLWKVSYNSEYGQPGPLAYKVDTLIVNRRIEEVGKPVPKLLRLGSLREIAEEVGVGANNNQAVKQALLQNAFAAITAKISYQAVDKTEHWAEIADTRYGVIFTGERLPDGKEADAVYLVLHDTYRAILDDAVTRPLDYDYMKALPPAAQRFYEIISYQIYAALRFNNPRAKLLYSQYCLLSTATRYFDFEHAKKQMYKVHRPHLESGYLGKVHYEITTDAEGQPDWFMYYLPGPNAAREFHEFTGNRLGNRRQRRGRSDEPLLLFPEWIPPAPAPAPAPLLSEPVAVLVPAELTESYALLLSVGFDEAAARQLCTDPFTGPKQKPATSPQDRAERIRRQCAWIIRRKTKTLGMLRRAIEQDYNEPGAIAVVAAATKSNAPAEAGPTRENARQSHEKAHRAAYHAYLLHLLREGVKSAHSEAYSAFREQEQQGRQLVEQRAYLKKHPEKLTLALAHYDSEEQELSRFRDFLAEQSKRGQRVEGVFTFWEWDKERNPNGFEQGTKCQKPPPPIGEETQAARKSRKKKTIPLEPVDDDPEAIRSLISQSFGGGDE